MAVDEVLHVHTHRTGALIQDGKLGLVVEQPGHLRARAHTHAHTHTRTYARTHTHTQSNKHTLTFLSFLISSLPSSLQTGGRGSINAGGDDDDDDVDMLIPRRSLLTPSEDSASDSFITVKTPWVLALEALLFIGLEVAVFLVPHFL